MAIFKCKMCGGTIEFEQGDSVGVCAYCGTKQTLPNTSEDVVTNLYNRANNLRLKSEFDRAQKVYEDIVNKDDSQAEAHWGIVLCKYGIEYVDDPATGKKIPTCHRTSYEAIRTDADYLAAIDYADTASQSVYEEEAREIDKIQRGILAIAKEEKPFDVFICYKETDESGSRTIDSTIANDIYYQLTQEGFKVFYAAITLEDKLGQEYEPYIFAALNSAKVMLAIGTKPEYFNAVWVKNEWSRYLKLMKTDRSRLLIPCYRDMDAYDLPEEFAHLQAQDMSKIGFINDVVRGIKKVLGKETLVETPPPVQTVSNESGNITALLDRGFMALEDGEWQRADDFFEQALNFDAKNAQAYFGKLMAQLKVRKEADLANCEQPFDNNGNYQKAVRFGTNDIANKLKGYIIYINERNDEARYNAAVAEMSKADSEKEYKVAAALYKAAAEGFSKIPNYKDAEQKKELCIQGSENAQKEHLYNYCKQIFSGTIEQNEENWIAAKDGFESLGDYKDSAEMALKCVDQAEELKRQKEELKRQAKERELQIGRQVDAIAKVIKEKNTGKQSASLLEQLAREKAKLSEVQPLVQVFDSVADEIQKAKSDLHNIDEELEKLKSKRASLGLFAGKEKKQIDAEVDTLTNKKVAIEAKIENKTAELQGFSTKQEVESTIQQIRGKISELEAKIQKAANEGNVELTYLQAIKLYYFDKNIRARFNAKYSVLVDSLKTIKFGSYYQSSKNSKEPIEWLVMDKKRKDILLISKYALDCERYNRKCVDVTWETCTLRKWLNETFFNAAFSDDEKKSIQSTTVTADKNPDYSTPPGNHTNDKVFLLSIDEVEKYFYSKTARKCKITAYAKEHSSVSGGFDWWLRSPGCTSNAATGVYYNGGNVDTLGINVNYKRAVRPAMWISLES